MTVHICLFLTFLSSFLVHGININRLSPLMQQVLDCDGSCKIELHSCIDRSANECMSICGRRSKEDKHAHGLNVTIGDWFDCYTECAVNAAIRCFIESSECIYSCKLPDNPLPPPPPSPPLPDSPLPPDQPIPPPQPQDIPPEPPQEDIQNTQFRHPFSHRLPHSQGRNPDPTTNFPPEMVGRTQRREAMRRRLREEQQRNGMGGLCASYSSSLSSPSCGYSGCCDECCDACLCAPLSSSLPLLSSSSSSSSSDADCSVLVAPPPSPLPPPSPSPDIDTTNDDDDDDPSSSSLFFGAFPGFGGFGGFPGFPGFGFGGFPGYGFGGFLGGPGYGFGGFPGFGFGGFPGFGFGGFPRFGFGGFPRPF